MSRPKDRPTRTGGVSYFPKIAWYGFAGWITVNKDEFGESGTFKYIEEYKPDSLDLYNSTKPGSVISYPVVENMDKKELDNKLLVIYFFILCSLGANIFIFIQMREIWQLLSQ